MSSTTKKTVCFGSQQEAIISPKEGHMIESVQVINTVNNEVIPSELVKISETPAQWACKFKQPAGNVVVKPKIVPILYTVTIEECDNCNIVLVDSDNLADIEINQVVEEDSEAADKSKEVPSNFNGPQHSFENGVEQTLDVEDAKEDIQEVIPGGDDNDLVSEKCDGNISEKHKDDDGIETEEAELKEPSSEPVATEPETSYQFDSEDEAQDQSTETNNDIVYDAGKFEADLVKKEPIKMTQAEYEKKCSIFFDYREAFTRGDISEKEYKDVEKKHNQLFQDIDEGRVVIL